jgi:hypothetical protein
MWQQGPQGELVIKGGGISSMGYNAKIEPGITVGREARFSCLNIYVINYALDI